MGPSAGQACAQPLSHATSPFTQKGYRVKMKCLLHSAETERAGQREMGSSDSELESIAHIANVPNQCCDSFYCLLLDTCVCNGKQEDPFQFGFAFCRKA